MKFAAAIFVLIGSVVTLVSSTVVSGASTPTFYLVSSSLTDSTNLLTLRENGGTNGYATLTGSGTIGEFFFYQGNFVAGSSTDRGYIAAVPSSSGCSTSGQLGFSGSSSDKCAIYSGFGLQSDGENSQLGAALSFGSGGGFYACGAGLDVWYFPSTPNSGCSPISLYTVPVSPVN